MYYNYPIREKIKSFFSSNVKLLIIFFLVLVITKSVISLQFNSPWIIDEILYYLSAKSIFENHFLIPISLFLSDFVLGYPFIISPAFLFWPDKNAIFHTVLILNTVLTSLVIFPSYFIIKKFCNDKISLLGALVIATLPSLNVYVYTMMSENLFIPLVIFSFWFIIEYYETFELKWMALTLISVFLLITTRVIGIAMLLGLIVACVYFVFINFKSETIMKPIWEKQHLVLPAGSLFLLLLYYFIFYLSAENIYRPTTRVNYVFLIFGNLFSPNSTFFLFLHELEFLILSSYFIFFVISILFIFLYFSNMPKIVEGFDNSSLKKINALKVGLVYAIISCVSTLILTISSQYSLQIFVYPDNAQYYEIYSRYLDPIVPLIVLIGIIGLSKYSEIIKTKSYLYFISISFILTEIIFYFTFPVHRFAWDDTLSIAYIGNLVDMKIALPVILLLFLIFFLCFVYSRPEKKMNILILAILISIVILGVIYSLELTHTLVWEDEGKIGRYLEENVDATSIIFINEQAVTPISRFFNYWDSKHEIVKLSNQTLDNAFHSPNSELYLITPRISDVEPLSCINFNQYCLYKLGKENLSYFNLTLNN
jgi:hypothetical protein